MIKEPKIRNANLLKRFDKINLEHFGGHLCGGIGWRRMPTARSVTLASCVLEERFIKVNKLLDDTRIPLWYLDAVLYHEMLHLYLGPQQFDSTSYAYPHNLRFQCLEKKHPDYAKTLEFENTKLLRIIEHWRKYKKSNKASLREVQLVSVRLRLFSSYGGTEDRGSISRYFGSW